MIRKTLQLQVSEVEDGVQVVQFQGDFDKAGFTDVRDELTGIVDNFAAEVLVFDFAALKFINSEGIGFLMEAYGNLAENKKKLVLVGPNAHVKDVFETIGLKDVVPVFDKMEDFKK